MLYTKHIRIVYIYYGQSHHFFMAPILPVVLRNKERLVRPVVRNSSSQPYFVQVSGTFGPPPPT